jgi:hypothetical protein
LGSAFFPAMLANDTDNLGLPRERALHTHRIDLVRPGPKLPKLTRSPADAGGAAHGDDPSRPLLDVRGLTVAVGRHEYRLVDGPIWPGAAIFLTVLSFNLLGDTLQDALDPRSRVRGA